MKKLISVLALSTVIVSCSFTQAFAQSEPSPKSIQKQLTQLEQQTNVEFVDVEELPEGTPIIYFDSVEELHKAIEAAQAIEKDEQAVVASVLDSANDPFTPLPIQEYTPSLPLDTGFYTTATATGTKRITWYLAESWDYALKWYLPSQMWIDLTYTYTGSGSTKKFSSITKVTSNSSGFPSTWKQEAKSTSFYDSNRGVTVKISGYHLLGVNMAGQSVGMKFPETYTKKYHF